MNSTHHVRSIHPSGQGWRNLSAFTAPVFHRPRPAVFQLIVGAGTHAAFLDKCLLAFVLPEPDAAKELGWQPPPAAHIPVVLAGRGEPDWSLDSDETKF